MVPKDEVITVISNIGLPVSGLNLALGDSSMISSADCEMLVQLSEEHHPTEGYIQELRKRFAIDLPTTEVFFLAPDITTQVLNFGLSAPIDLQVVGPLANKDKSYRVARILRDQLAKVPGAVDVHLAQVAYQPEVRMNIDRTEASEQGVTMHDVSNEAVVSLSSSGQVSPNFWLDPKKRGPVPRGRADAAVQDGLVRRRPADAGAPAALEPAGDARQPRLVQPRLGAGQRHPLQRAACLRRAGQRRRRRPRLGGGRHRPAGGRGQQDPPPRHHHHRAWSGGEHEVELPRSRLRDHRRRDARLLPHGGELPVLARPAHHPLGAPRRARRHRLDALCFRHAPLGPRSHGRHHEHRRRHLEQHLDGHLRQRPDGRGDGAPPGPPGWPESPASAPS